MTDDGTITIPRDLFERLKELEDAKLHAPTLCAYWYWCDEIRKTKNEAVAIRDGGKQ